MQKGVNSRKKSWKIWNEGRTNMMFKLKEGIGLFGLKDVINNEERIYRPTVLWDEKDVILIDTGFPGHLEEIQEYVKGLTGRKISKIIITHQDYDHLGGLSEIRKGHDENIQVYSHELTKPYIQGEKPLIKTESTVPGTEVDFTISDNEYLPFCGGLTVLFTPGHTPDHISLYHHSTKTLITGDALTADNEELQYPNKVYTLNMEQAIQSVSRFLDLELDSVICFHGGVVSENIQERLSFIASGK